MSDIRRINFYGPPCSGKDTAAAHIFSKMKIDGYNVEFINEYVKQWTYIDRIPKAWDQVYLAGKQLQTEYTALSAGFDYIVSPSPLFLTGYYGMRLGCKVKDNILDIFRAFEEEYPSLHIFLDNNDLTYHKTGRFHTKTQSDEIGAEILIFLSKELGDFHVVDSKDLDKVYKIVKSECPI
jgi:hypothetical protein